MPAILRRAPLLVLPLLLLGLGLRADALRLKPAATGQKPMFPVLTTLQAAGSAGAGGLVQALATVQAWAPGESVEWELVLPDGVTLLAGPARWSGRLDRGETKSFELTFDVSGPGHFEITARAWIPERPGATSAAMLPVEPAGPAGLAATERLVTADGATYIQYQGEVTPRKEAR